MQFNIIYHCIKSMKEDKREGKQCQLLGGGGHSAFEDNAISTERHISESLLSLRVGAWIPSQQRPDLLTLLGPWMGAALRAGHRETAPFTSLWFRKTQLHKST